MQNMNVTKDKKVSVLITTFSRPEKLERAISSVLNQTYKNIELIIIDDAATIETVRIINNFLTKDSRITHIRNEKNIGAKCGDIVHIRRFIYELATGDYFIYLCDDDYWLSNDFLENAVHLFRYRETTVAVIYGQLSIFLSKTKVGEYEKGKSLFRITDETLKDFLEENYTSKHFAVSYMQALNSQPLFQNWAMTSDQYLNEFSKDPALRNIIVGGTLYNSLLFKKSKSLLKESGSKWQAGYELLITPSIYGDVIYIDKPMIITEIDIKNASFRGTQLDHLNDCISGIIAAFSWALKDPSKKNRHKELKSYKAITIANICMSFLGNTSTILRNLQLTDCSDDNTSKYLTPIKFIQLIIKHRALFKITLSQWKIIMRVFKLYVLKNFI